MRSYKNNDEIQIAIHNQDLYVLPSESFLHIQGRITKVDDKIETTMALLNSCIAYLFSEIRYELNGIEIDRTRHLGVTSDLKNYSSIKQNQEHLLENSGWSIADNLKLERGNFNFCVPLNLLLGFAEDYNKILLNGKYELVLLRGKDNDDLYKSTAEALTMSQLKITISSIVWKMPHVQLSDAYKLYMFNVINKQTPLLIPFRCWDIYYNPVVPQTTTFIWSVKLSHLKTIRSMFIAI